MKTPEEVNKAVQRFPVQVTNGKVEGSGKIALATVSLLEKIISEISHDNAAQLLTTIRDVGRQLLETQEGVPANMVRRVLRIIRDEYHALNESASGVGADAQGASLQQLVRAAAARRSVHLESMLVRAPVLDHIAEFKTELEASADNIVSQAPEHIHSNELVLTFGASRLLERFLKRAARERTFHIILASGDECSKSHQMAVNLAKTKIEVTVIADCAVMAVMSRVNKVIMSTQSVLASGGLRATAGSHTVALAAKHYSVPVIVLAPLYKLCPVHRCSYEQDDFNTLLSPESVLPYETGDIVSKTHVYAPKYDYVPPDLVTLFVTNLGGNSPSYVYRMMSELYDPNDYEL